MLAKQEVGCPCEGVPVLLKLIDNSLESAFQVVYLGFINLFLAFVQPPLVFR